MKEMREKSLIGILIKSQQIISMKFEQKKAINGV